MVIHLGLIINVKLSYYVHKTTSVYHLHYFYHTHQSINRMASFLDALHKPSVRILVLAWHEMMFKHDSKRSKYFFKFKSAIRIQSYPMS